MEQLDIKSLYEEELKEKMISLGEKPFKGKQLYQWLHQKAAGSYEKMTNLSEGLRKKLTEQEPLTHLEVVEVQTSKIDGTQKYLFQLADGNVIESVWMQYKHGNSVCISSQVGCRMGCRFCASTIGGLTRNLLPSEMLDQVYRIQELTGERVSNVVVMGTGPHRGRKRRAALHRRCRRGHCQRRAQGLHLQRCHPVGAALPPCL